MTFVGHPVLLLCFVFFQIICQKRLFEQPLEAEEECLFIFDRRQEQSGEIACVRHADIGEDLVADMGDLFFFEFRLGQEVLHRAGQRLVRIGIGDESE